MLSVEREREREREIKELLDRVVCCIFPPLKCHLFSKTGNCRMIDFLTRWESDDDWLLVPHHQRKEAPSAIQWRI